MPSESNLYLNLLSYLLLGKTKEVDEYLSNPEARLSLIKGRNQLIQKHNLQLKTKKLYRGILLEEDALLSSGTKLKPLNYIQTISFTEDKKVALTFADTKSEISSFVMFARPKSVGYLIEYTPWETEILFDYSWTETLDLLNLFPFLDIEVINEQKEIILLQRGICFDVKRV